MSEAARAAAELAARTSYGRLLAVLAARSRDIAAAEDALAEAFAAALRTWPETGAPESPEAWLLTAARRVLGHDVRHRGVREKATATIALAYEELAAAEPSAFPDERLKLMLACAHPAIDAAVRTPLMLQTVLGLDAARIGAAFLVAPSTMGQRLVRAKAKIRDAGLAFAVPEAEQLPERLDDVLSAVYAAFGTGWDAVAGAEEGTQGLAAEALYLGRLLVALLPDAAEAKGLLALMLYCDARTAARRTTDGRFVPLDRQDATLWSRDRIIEAEALLFEAARAGRFGRFQTEAAIQSVHVQRAVTGRLQGDALIALYDLLATQAPTLGVLVARAAAYGEALGTAAGLAALDALPAADVARYQPYWAARFHLLAAAGDPAAAGARERAASLTDDPAIRAFLLSRPLPPDVPGV